MIASIACKHMQLAETASLRSVVVPMVLASLLVGCAQRSEPAPVDTVYTGRTVHDFSRGSLSDQSYQVQQGDTLYSIAFRAEMDLRDIARLNSLQEPYRIQPGQVLRLAPQAPTEPVAIVNTPQDRSINSQVSVKERKDTNQNDLSRTVEGKVEQEYGKNRTDEQSSQGQSPVRPAQQRATTSPSTGTSSTQSVSNTNSEGRPIEWQWPSQGRIARRFSDDRPGASGIIFSGVKGDPVTAAAAGKVVYVGSALRGFGRLIILKHNDDFITAYAHNERLLVDEQEWVAAGQQIATMGDSDADDVRLRFELRYQGSSVNPEQYLPRSR